MLAELGSCHARRQRDGQSWVKARPAAAIARPAAKLPTMFIPASSRSPVSASVSDSHAQVESVVYPPANPVPMINVGA